MDLYNTTTFECSKLITEYYSTSFTLGIKTLDKRFHFPIYAIYGFVRYADEIVDTFHGFDKKALLNTFRTDTFKAIDEKISLNPVIHSFQMVVNEYQIDHDLIKAFLHSMEMDLYQSEYNQVGYEEYIYGSAEVVGLMCLRVFCEGNNEMYQALKDDARSLGSAFQKVNFLRDLKHDYETLGRIYFPGINFSSLTNENKKQIVAEIEADFEEAFKGILQLPVEAKFGVYTAFRYYRSLMNKISKTQPEEFLNARIRISNPLKLVILSKSYLRYQFNIIA